MNKPASKRDQRRALHQELGRNQILDAAEEIFASKGFHEATIKEIAEFAEFSVGAVYSFFENKDDLFVQIYLRRGEEFMEGMRNLLAGDAAPLEQLRELATYQVQFMRDHPNFGRLYLRDSAVVIGEIESRIDQAVADRYAEAMSLQAKIFERGQREGLFRLAEPRILARLFSGLVASYQASDPAVMNGADGGLEPMPLEELLEILEGAFRAPA